MKNNKIITIINIIYQFFISIFFSVILFLNSLLGKKQKPLKENKLLDIINFILHIGPKSFWQKPTGIKIGRSLSTFINYIFEKEKYFKEK